MAAPNRSFVADKPDSMTPDEIAQIKKSWKLLRSLDPLLVADVFYSKLFSLHPPLRRLFPTEMQTQYQKLMDMLGTLVARLDSDNSNAQVIAEMGARHHKYGARPAHYRYVGNALVWTLQKALGTYDADPCLLAWKKWYEELASQMLRTADSDGYRSDTSITR
jgi:hemoglobin-like flavoprotein